MGGFDPDLVEVLVERSATAGVELRRNATVSSITATGDA